MKAVLLAAGKGARMWPFTAYKPKGMIPAANKPILEHVVAALVENNVREIVMVVGYQPERIMSYFEEGKKFGARVEYVSQMKQLGTAHALWEARSKIDDKFIVLNGSNVVNAQAVADLIHQDETPAVLITESETPTKYGEVVERDGCLERIVEKPTESVSHLINTGMYLLDKSFFEVGEPLIREGKYDIPSILQHLAAQTRVRVVRTAGKWADALYPWDLLRLNAAALVDVGEGRAGRIEKEVQFQGRVMVGDGTTIRSGTYVNGPAIIAEGCEIGPHVVINPSTSIGKNVRIGPFTEVKDSILMDDVSIGSGSVVANSVIGKGSNLGTRFTSLSGAANMEVEGEWHRVETVGSMIGDDVVVAGGVVVEPGTIVGARCTVGAMVRLRGNLANGSKVV
jgi:UDP-N-acetylglucosamine diphosphorylase/glucosamine-1-phosphate N-acetyltransferase